MFLGRDLSHCLWYGLQADDSRTLTLLIITRLNAVFQKIRTRLLLNNLLVFALVLTGAAIAVRLVFVQNLKEQAAARLLAVGQGISSEAELDSNGILEVEDEFREQAPLFEYHSFEWFTLQGMLVEDIGDFPLNTPLDTQVVSGFEKLGENQILFVTIPVMDEDTTGGQIGYVRVSQLLVELEETVRQLDIGLSVGVIVATMLASIGILWLNKQAMKPIEESFQRLKQFTADASHELRSPLMAISSNAEVSMKYSDGMRPSDFDAMASVLSASEQITSLTEDLLLLARTDKASAIKSESLNLSNLLKDVVQLYTPQANQKDIQITTTIQPALSLKGDSVSLTRAFTNLLQNAIRYTPSGGKVEVLLKAWGNRLQVMVKDTGVGIAKENLEKVFERFWRADRARSYDDGGSGLGLSITQAIIHSHDGTIEVTSDVGCGSCFVVDLPMGSTALRRES